VGIRSAFSWKVRIVILVIIKNKTMENTDFNPNQTGEISPQTTKKAKYKPFSAILVLAVLISSSFGAIFGFIGGNLGQKMLRSKIFAKIPFSSEQQSSKSASVVKQQIVEEDSAVIDVVDKSSPAVVSIVISKDVPKLRGFSGDPFEYFFGIPNQDSQGQGGTQKQTIGGGTGFFITVDGMIVTNKHVVSDTTADYTVITSDSKEYVAKVLARDPVNDIAVIKIEGNSFPVLSLGGSDTLKIGQTVIAIGNSLGEFSNTVSKGIISGLKRTVTAGGGIEGSETLTNIVQTDAAINPGNSGGPLLDINGEVIGINVAMAQGAQNIGFAIPSNQISKIVDQVKKTGKITTPYIGVRYVPVDDTLQKENSLPYNYGVLVARGQRLTDFAVIPGSPADKAGLVENDIILEADGTKIDDKNTLSSIIAEHNVGDSITLKVWHKGNTQDMKVTLEERK
jgi:serine protease Do